MQLHTHTWGEGDRVALLIHGIMADHRTWRRVGPALADLGYRVIAVDLRGHGESGRGEYGPEAFADDVVETLPTGAELAIGHSLGGLTLSYAVERLQPRRAVYSDPAWHLATPEPGFGPEMFAQFKAAPKGQIQAMNPRWEEADVDIELETLAVWDEATALSLAPLMGADLLPAAPVVPSLVQLADPSFLISQERAAVLEARGFEVRSVPGAGHTIHRDDFDGFMASLEGWI
ncbi:MULTISPECIES: alpha/beta fold hydrolase [unclassified Streptomyces]|uniref:alpha/beta fold hydrolase n=1 Tax=unclassified Streptomyces TaxID=2593676 RepID=UPI000DC76799|nr:MULTISPECIES: alpha/beta fold hydrolase [unclassified Streptomyces]AWZ09833.1 alpha/beta hydrolase [Streptomyces sp. ICC4]AWZ17514.1 alpha/beta hydrolase [Streptomyces sp. ICC1]